MKSRRSPPPRAPASTNAAPAKAAPKRKIGAVEANRLRGCYTNDYGYVYNAVPPPAVTNRAEDSMVKTLPERVFDNVADIRIATLVSAEPGAVFVGDSACLYDSSFKRRFLDSLKVPIIVSANDSEEVAALKRDVRDAKIELKARMDEGEDICKIMTDTRKELQTLGLYKQQLQQEVEKYSMKRDLTEADVKEFVEAANTLLKNRGLPPLSMPTMVARKFERMKNKKGVNQ